MAMRKNSFENGYFCAVAALLRMEGCVNAQIRELFEGGGDPAKADRFDVELFRAHGLISDGQAPAQEPGEQKGST